MGADVLRRQMGRWGIQGGRWHRLEDCTEALVTRRARQATSMPARCTTSPRTTMARPRAAVFVSAGAPTQIGGL
jgi:hypothetical protein